MINQPDILNNIKIEWLLHIEPEFLQQTQSSSKMLFHIKQLWVSLTNPNICFQWAQIYHDLDMEHGEFILRSKLNNCIIEQRLYAHRKYAHLQVHELQIVEQSISGCSSVNIILERDSGALSSDINFSLVNSTIPNVAVQFGTITQSETPVSTKIKHRWCQLQLTMRWIDKFDCKCCSMYHSFTQWNNWTISSAIVFNRIVVSLEFSWWMRVKY
jgi:hypothetical protein